MNHAALIAAIKDLCDELGLYCGIMDGIRSTKGMVDLVIIGRGVLLAEVKSEDGRRTMPQIECAERIVYRLAGVATYRLYRPADLESGQIKIDLARIA